MRYDAMCYEENFLGLRFGPQYSMRPQRLWIGFAYIGRRSI